MSSENYETTPAPLAQVEAADPQVLPPRDPRGGNAQRHGILSEHVPPSERAEYAAHVAHIREGAGASTYLEQRLADRAALALWRLDRVARYEAAQVSTAQRGARASIEKGSEYGPEGQAVKAWARLAKVCGLSVEQLRADPQWVEAEAQRFEGYAAHFLRWASGGSAEGLTDGEALNLGAALGAELEDREARPADMVRAMMGRPARRGEAASIEEGEWTYEPGELPGLLTFAREYLGAEAGAVLGELAQAEGRRAARIREGLREALGAQADALALAALPPPQTLVQRSFNTNGFVVPS
ncbi:hypothetical protein [Deinococcus sp. NW-56]|uniref:hypothetical protein n=1 Tax=Deinococcus sp. NW-56 TaxID=2080419 RepID=UPI000CF46143|nr:hypothetical protein [Deinococcus sp. NW-56]